MAKKKKSIELSSKKIKFTIEKREFKVIRYYPTQMSLDTIEYFNGEKIGLANIPFSHIPKEIKKLIKPN